MYVPYIGALVCASTHGLHMEIIFLHVKETTKENIDRNKERKKERKKQSKQRRKQPSKYRQGQKKESIVEKKTEKEKH